MAVAVKGKPETLSDTVAEPSLEAAAVAPGFAGQRTGSATLSHSPARQIVPFPEWISLRHTQLRPAVQVFPEPTFQSQHGLPGFPLPPGESALPGLRQKSLHQRWSLELALVLSLQ